VAEGNEQKRKRMKVDTDVTRVSPSMRNQIEAYASLKGEQVQQQQLLLSFEFPPKLANFFVASDLCRLLQESQLKMPRRMNGLW
jgi:hypothetical protein